MLPLRGTLGEDDAMPTPLPVAVHEAVNPTPHLLLSFPAPQLVAPTPLPKDGGDECSLPFPQDEEGAAHQHSDSRAWDYSAIDAISRELNESAAILVQSNKFTRFLQEELHHETMLLRPLQTHATPAASSPSPASPPEVINPAGKRHVSTEEAAQALSSTLLHSLRAMLTGGSRQRTIDDPTSLGCSSSESWVPAIKAGSGGMALRPRRAQPVALPLRAQAVGKEVDAKVSFSSSVQTSATGGPAVKSQRPTSPLPPHPLAIASSPKTANVVEATFPDAAREVMENTEAMLNDVTALQQFSSLLPLYPEPFKDVPAERLTQFLSLMAGAASAPCEPVAEVKAETADGEETTDESDSSNWKRSAAITRRGGTGQQHPLGRRIEVAEATEWKGAVQGLCCVTAVTHHTFPTQAIPDQLVECIVTVLGSVVRCAARAISRPAAEIGSLSEEVTRAASLTRGGGRRGEESESGGKIHGEAVPSAIAAAATEAGKPTTFMWVEMLRLFLQRFSLVVCNREVNLVCEADLERLEESVFHCLFLVPHRSATRDVFLTYSSYVMDAAVHAYGCVWNRLVAQRAITADRFFLRVLLSEYLTVRTYSAADGKKLMPLTIAVLSAAQSTPLSTLPSSDRIDSRAADRLYHQCSVWASAMVAQLLLPHIRREEEKATQDAAWLAVSQLLEDLVDLLGAPEWPAADPLLRSCVFALARVGLGFGGGRSAAGASPPSSRPSQLSPSPDMNGVDAAQLAAHVVDVIALITTRLLDPVAMTLTGAEAVERFCTEAQVDSAMVEAWRQVTAAATPSAPGQGHDGTARGRKRRRRIHKGTNSSDEELLPADHDTTDTNANGDTTAAAGAVDASPHGGENETVESTSSRLECLVYYAISRNAETSLAADASSSWLHARAAHVLCWHRYQRFSLPEAAMDKLVRAKAVPCGGLEVLWGKLRCWCRALASVEERSMLHPKMHQALISLLLSVFHGRDVHGVEVTVSDTVIKKALSHLSKLTDLYPPLVQHVWLIARRCVRDDNARVRESSVPILLTLLSGLVGDRIATAGPRPDEEEQAQEVVATLVHLLHDKSVAVVTRAIAALDTLLVDRQHRWLLSPGRGAAVLSFVQFNLLPLTARDAERKHQRDVTRHFLRRWAVTLMEDDTLPGPSVTASVGGGQMQLANELLTLTKSVTDGFPYEVTADNVLVQLLLQMQHMTVGGTTEGMSHRLLHHGHSASAAASTVGLTAASTSAMGRRKNRYAVESQQLDHAMRGAVRALWGQYQSPAATPFEAVGCLATLHVLALANRGWVEGLLEQLARCLADSPTARFPDAADEGFFIAGTRLQVCFIVRAVLAAPKVPTISFHALSQQLMRVLSKYVGKLQTRVMVAAIGALTAMITSGVKHRLSNEVNVVQLVQCYSAMNTYYVQVMWLVDRLESDERTIAYAQRYLYVLAEFLRQYPGWKNAELTQLLLPKDDADNTASNPSQTPNLLAKGAGIACNVFDVVERVLAKCLPGSNDAHRPLFGICLRVLASLCMLEPTTYLYRCESFLHVALRSTDTSTQVQGLTFIRDFLVEEDSRVDLAARLTDRMYRTSPDGDGGDTTSRHSGNRKRGRRGAPRQGGRRSDSEGEKEDEDEGSGEEAEEESLDSGLESGGERRLHGKRNDACKRAGKKGGAAATRAASSSMEVIADQNSGMSTWLIQSFHAEIVAHALSGNEQVRSLCLDILQVVAQGGLQPPVKYLDTVMALSTDVSARIRSKASQLLLSHVERYEDVIAAQMPRAIPLAYNLHYACGACLLASARTSEVVASTGPGATAENSVYAPIFARLHKRNRDNITVTLTRFFYQDTRAASWCRDYYSPSAWPESRRRVVGAPEALSRNRNPVTFLAHLAVALGLCPFSETDAVNLLQHCRTAIDLNGQSCLDAVAALLASCGEGNVCDEDEDEDATQDSPSTTEALTMDLLTLWKCVGVVLMAAVRRELRTEHHLTSARLQRFSTQAAAAGAVHVTAAAPPSRGGREVRRLAVKQLLTSAATLVHMASPLLLLVPPLPGTPIPEPLTPATQVAVHKALGYMHAELEVALTEEGTEEQLPSDATSYTRGERQKMSRAAKAGRMQGKRSAPATKQGGRAGTAKRRRRRKAALDSTDPEETENDASSDPDGDDEGDKEGALTATATNTTAACSSADEVTVTDDETIVSDGSEPVDDSSHAAEGDV